MNTKLKLNQKEKDFIISVQDLLEKKKYKGVLFLLSIVTHDGNMNSERVDTAKIISFLKNAIGVNLLKEADVIYAN